MSNLDFILQGLSPTDDHFAALQRLFSLTDISAGVIASAFMNAAGASMLVEKITPISNRVKVFVGIRNDITTLQAIQTLIQNNIFPYLVDTATRAFIFHPKVYLTRNAERALLLVGSANATSGGMVKNVEASLCAELNMQNPTEADLADTVMHSFDELISNYPENVFQVTPITDLNVLAEQGMLIDQNAEQYQTRMRATRRTRTETRTRMRLHTRTIPTLHRSARQATERVPIRGTQTEVIATRNNRLLWRSSGLTRRDLCIPDSPGTNQTGSMLLKKGAATQNIDQRSYFREIVFANEAWMRDTRPGKTHMERCFCNFDVIIKGIDYGIYRLQLSHNSRTDTRAYEQRNSMTQIHWGPDVKALIAHSDLLGCVLSVYAPREGEDVYTLVFDDDE